MIDTIFYKNLFLSTTLCFIILFSVSFGQVDTKKNNIHSFKINTFDNLELHGQILNPVNDIHTSRRFIVFIQGGTPYDEKGNTAAECDSLGNVIVTKDDFYTRFPQKMSEKGYHVVTLAKRSFKYFTRIPRPCLDDLSKDIQYLFKELKDRKFVKDDDKIFIVGHSEGSIVATKLLPLLADKPVGCVLLGSGSFAFDYENQTWEEWFFNDIMRKYSKMPDEAIKEIFEKVKRLQLDILKISEKTFENDWKKNTYAGIDPAPWESYHIIKEYPFYSPIPNIIQADVPILICVGEMDTAMPATLAERTYNQLSENGFEKCTLKIIESEKHDYKKEEMFEIADEWFRSLD